MMENVLLLLKNVLGVVFIYLTNNGYLILCFSHDLHVVL